MGVVCMHDWVCVFGCIYVCIGVIVDWVCCCGCVHTYTHVRIIHVCMLLDLSSHSSCPSEICKYITHSGAPVLLQDTSGRNCLNTKC